MTIIVNSQQPILALWTAISCLRQENLAKVHPKGEPGADATLANWNEPQETQVAFRFSRKARKPSCPSSLTRSVAIISAVKRLAVS